MNKVQLILNVLLIIIFILITSTYVYAVDSIGEIMDDAESFINKDQSIVFSDMKSFSDILYVVLFSIGLIIAVIVGIVLGIQYMYSSAENKAKTKENLFAYIVGCVVLFSAFGIWKVVVLIGNDIAVETSTTTVSSETSNVEANNEKKEVDSTKKENENENEKQKENENEKQKEKENEKENEKATLVPKERDTTTSANPTESTSSPKTKKVSNKKINKTLKESDFKYILTTNAEYSRCTSFQSFCVTENYYVCALVNGNTNNETSIQIYNKETKKLEKKIKCDFYHANGMTYNSRNKNVYIAHMNNKKCSSIAINDLLKSGVSKANTQQLNKSTSAIAYDVYTNQYYGAAGSNMFIYDSDFKYQKTIKKSIVHTPQDIGAYRGIVLVVDYQANNNAIDIYRVSDNKYLGRYKIELKGELESVCYDEQNKCFTLSINNGSKGDSLYYTKAIDLEDYYI